MTKLAAHLVLACSTDDISKVKRQFPGEGASPILYLYLGKDFFRLRQWEQTLGSHFRRIDIARLLDEVAEEIREDHVQWMDQLNRRYGRDLEWWFGTISSRDIHKSDLFQYSCYLETLRRLWEAGQLRPHLVLVESWGLAAAVMNWAGQNGIPVKNIGNRAFSQEFGKKLIVSILRWGYFTFTAVIRVLAAYVSRREGAPKGDFSGPLAIVDTFVFASNWSPDGTYKDSYFSGLFEFLRDHGLKVLIHPVLYGFRVKSYPAVYRRMRQGGKTFIIPEDWLKFSDYLSMLTFPWRYALRRIEAQPFLGFDLGDILWEEKVVGGSTSSLLAILIYRLFLRLGETPARPQIIINWYENQVIDRALVAGARRAFPHTTIIGAQIFLHFANFLNNAPSASEAEAHMVPHVLLATSDHQCRASQVFTHEIPCVPAAALRYAHIFEGPGSEDDQKPDGAVILVLLPFLLDDSLELLSLVAAALENFPDDVALWIKCHPAYPPTDLTRLYGPKLWPERFIIFTGGLPEAFRRAAVVISRGTSALVEALTWGIPVLMVSKQTTLTPKITGTENISFLKECFTPAELAAALNEVLRQGEIHVQKYREEGKEIRERFFTPVTPQTLRPYLGIDEN